MVTYIIICLRVYHIRVIVYREREREIMRVYQWLGYKIRTACEEYKEKTRMIA